MSWTLKNEVCEGEEKNNMNKEVWNDKEFSEVQPAEHN